MLHFGPSEFELLNTGMTENAILLQYKNQLLDIELALAQSSTAKQNTVARALSG